MRGIFGFKCDVAIPPHAWIILVDLPFFLVRSENTFF